MGVHGRHPQRNRGERDVACEAAAMPVQLVSWPSRRKSALTPCLFLGRCSRAYPPDSLIHRGSGDGEQLLEVPTVCSVNAARKLTPCRRLKIDPLVVFLYLCE